MKVHLPDNYRSNIDQFIKILKKKFSFEGCLDTIKRKQRHMSKKKIKEHKRVKKHLFRKHLKDQK
ncbi:30S ribosomal protein S21 [uncultured bacterium]|nr:30S ribosomal protein S21 [uncultured bacterium]